MEDYIQTVVLDQKKVRQEIADVERRVTAQALTIATQGATIASLDRSVGAIVDHQVKALEHWRIVRRTVEAVFARQQMMGNEREQDLVLRQHSHEEILGALHTVRRTLIALGAVTLAGLITLAIVLWP